MAPVWNGSTPVLKRNHYLFETVVLPFWNGTTSCLKRKYSRFETEPLPAWNRTGPVLKREYYRFDNGTVHWPGTSTTVQALWWRSLRHHFFLNCRSATKLSSNSLTPPPPPLPHSSPSSSSPSILPGVKLWTRNWKNFPSPKTGIEQGIDVYDVSSPRA